MAAPKKIELATDRPIYERQTGEPDKSWSAFVYYRNMEGKRTLAGSARLYQKEHGVKGGKTLEDRFGKLSSRNRWRERVEEWDRILDKRLREQRISVRAEMQRRHIELGKSLQGVGALGAKQLYNELKARVVGGAILLSATEIAALVDKGTKMERLNLGEPDAIQETRHVFDVDKERDVLQALVKHPDLVDAISEALRDEDDDDEG